MLGTRGKIKNHAPPTPSKRRKQGPSWVHAEPSHWLHEIFMFQNCLSPFLDLANTPIINWGYLFIYCCRLINSRVPTSPVAYLRILELDWKEHCLKLLWPQRFESSKLYPSSFFKCFFGTNGRKKIHCRTRRTKSSKPKPGQRLTLPFLLKSWFEVKKIWTLDVTGSKNCSPLNLYSWKLDIFSWASDFYFVLGDKSTAWRIPQLLLSITSRNLILCNPFRLTLKCEALNYAKQNYLVTLDFFFVTNLWKFTRQNK